MVNISPSDLDIIISWETQHCGNIYQGKELVFTYFQSKWCKHRLNHLSHSYREKLKELLFHVGVTPTWTPNAKEIKLEAEWKNKRAKTVLQAFPLVWIVLLLMMRIIFICIVLLRATTECFQNE